MGLRNVIEHGMRASESQAQREFRKEQVRLLEPPVKRLAVQAIDAAVFTFTSARRYISERDARAMGLQRIGDGVECDVFRLGDSVIKYARHSIKMPPSERQQLAERKREDFAKLGAELGRFLPDQTISVEPHLFRPGREVVQTTQPFVAFTPLMETRGVLIHRIALLDTAASVADQLSDFVDGARAVLRTEKVAPDIIGRDNLVIDETGGLQLIDTQPIGAETEASRRLQEEIRTHLLSISMQLDQIAA